MLERDDFAKRLASGHSISIHELLHGLGFAMPCTKGVTRGAHLNSGILGPNLDRKLGKAIYEHGDPTCPDLKDSAYLTPTSDTPFDPIPIAMKDEGDDDEIAECLMDVNVLIV